MKDSDRIWMCLYVVAVAVQFYIIGKGGSNWWFLLTAMTFCGIYGCLVRSKK